MEQTCLIKNNVGSPPAVSKSPVGFKTPYKDFLLLSEELGYHVDEAVDEEMLSLYQALLLTFGRTFVVPHGVGAISRTRSIVSSWAPLKHESAKFDPNFHVEEALSHFFKRYLSAGEQLTSESLEHQANWSSLLLMLEGRDINARIRSDDSLNGLFSSMRHIISLALEEFSLLNIYEDMRHGPNSTSTISKSASYPDVKDADITGTRSALQQYWHFLRWDSRLKEYLVDTSDDMRRFINALDFSVVNVVDSTPTLQVAKEYDKLRTIRQEPTVPAKFAQGYAAHLTRALFKVGIDLETQPESHRLLAKLGSQYPELNIATLDWSEASERVWMAVVEETFPEEDVAFIKACCRTPCTEIVFKFSKNEKARLSDRTYTDLMSLIQGKSGEYADLKDHKDVLHHVSNDGIVRYDVCEGKRDLIVKVIVETPMVATMGNPITFPLQTLIFYAFLAACSDEAALRLAKDPKEKGPSDMFVSCFGDDGICSTRVFPEIQSYADRLGWILNDKKSYFSGKYRESCGGDFYHGMAVRPVRPKRPPQTRNGDLSLSGEKRVLQAWSYTAANAVCDLVTRYGYRSVFIQEWLVAFHKRFQLGKICLVPPHYSDGSGFRVNLQRSFTYRENGKVITFALRDDEVALIVDGVTDAFIEHCHIPTFESVQHCYSFRALQSRPRKIRPLGLGEISYYNLSARAFTRVNGSLDTTMCPKTLLMRGYGGVRVNRAFDSLRVPKFSGFFDIDDSVNALTNGEVPMKELRIMKSWEQSPSWDYFLPVIYLL